MAIIDKNLLDQYRELFKETPNTVCYHGYENHPNVVNIEEMYLRRFNGKRTKVVNDAVQHIVDHLLKKRFRT